MRKLEFVNEERLLAFLDSEVIGRQRRGRTCRGAINRDNPGRIAENVQMHEFENGNTESVEEQADVPPPVTETTSYHLNILNISLIVGETQLARKLWKLTFQRWETSGTIRNMYITSLFNLTLAS